MQEPNRNRVKERYIIQCIFRRLFYFNSIVYLNYDLLYRHIDNNTIEFVLKIFFCLIKWFKSDKIASIKLPQFFFGNPFEIRPEQKQNLQVKPRTQTEPIYENQFGVRTEIRTATGVSLLWDAYNDLIRILL